MPTFCVTFDQAVQYQPDHPEVNLLTETLIVHADTADAALIHALRVTRGAGSVVSVEPCAKPRAAGVQEVPQAQETISYA